MIFRSQMSRVGSYAPNFSLSKSAVLLLSFQSIHGLPKPKPESDPVPGPEPEFDANYEEDVAHGASSPEAFPEPLAEGDSLNLSNKPEPDDDDWHVAYEKNEGYQRGLDDHVISVHKNVPARAYSALTDVMQEQNDAQLGRSFSDFVKMAFWQATLSIEEIGHTFTDIHDVSFNDAQNWWKDNFVDHGCYCWPDRENILQDMTNANRLHDSQKIHGFGTPKDELDEECFDLYSCYRCVSLQPQCKNVDWVNTHYDCQFVSHVKNEDGTNTTRLEITCNDPDPCNQSLCECDKKFALNAKKALEKKNAKNSKIFPDECIRQPHDDSKKKCCGTWPDVKPFPTDKKCCSGKKIYGLDEQICTDEDIAYDMTWEDFYDGAAVSLNMNNPNITNHDHTADHTDADHIHPMHVMSG